ncbi:MAG: hypothetical protein IPG50_11510 [Myxococcales bacterium]|nr:hypothetical protein [Myxococcales bacterium]
MAAVLGEHKTETFDPATGQAYFRALEAGRKKGEGDDVVHLLPLEDSPDSQDGADAVRDLEAEALAAYVRWLVDKSELTVVDADTREARPVRTSDIAVLARATTSLKILFAAFRPRRRALCASGRAALLESIRCTSSFFWASAPSATRTTAALAALLRPPFFAIDPVGSLAGQGQATQALEGVDLEAAARAEEAAAWVMELRRWSVGGGASATRRVACSTRRLRAGGRPGPNGRSACHLRELIFALERVGDAGSSTSTAS